MTPQDLKRANIERFKRLLSEGPDAGRRQRIEALLAEERTKPLNSYPNLVTLRDRAGNRLKRTLSLYPLVQKNPSGRH